MPRVLDAKLEVIDEIERTMAVSVHDDESTIDDNVLKALCRLTEAELYSLNAWLASRVKALREALVLESL